jgi:hypothetical protein
MERLYLRQVCSIRIMPAEDLKDLGVGFVGDRRKLLDAIAALRAGASAPTTLSDAPPDEERPEALN